MASDQKHSPTTRSECNPTWLNYLLLLENTSETHQKMRCFHPYKERLVLCIELVQLREGPTFLVYTLLLRTEEML